MARTHGPDRNSQGRTKSRHEALNAESGGPPNQDAEAIESLLKAWPREIGRIAVESGSQLEVLLGMLDSGLDVSGTIDALVMHGDIPGFGPDVLEAPSRLSLSESEGGWRFEQAS